MSTSETAGDLLSAFAEGRIDPAQFPHRAHVEGSYELLERHRFPKALLHPARGLCRLATKAGKPEIYEPSVLQSELARETFVLPLRKIAARILGPESPPRIHFT